MHYFVQFTKVARVGIKYKAGLSSGVYAIFTKKATIKAASLLRLGYQDSNLNRQNQNL